ncbi:hypothetical protein OSB04_021542 [Centaurea solstitialis]|uniref:Uncharacterized protein n=1 Tax=Centaurea solstitialis TaxID=347529 RepID=A0AA38SUD7_9ASTR|nr:hypothetical protein OSB04_021542 [Centaurea solstitialis]
MMVVGGGGWRWWWLPVARDGGFWHWMIRAFNLTIHYDGCFMYQPLRYENGQSFEVTVERTTYEEMVSFIEFDTKTVIAGLYYCIPGNELEKGLMKLDNTYDVECLFDISENYGPVELFVDHFGDDLSLYLVENDQQNGGEAMVDDEGNLIAEIDKNVKKKEDEDGENYLEDVEIEYEGEDDETSDYEGEDDEMSDVHSIDHLSEGEDEVMQVRKGKQQGQSLPKEKPKLGVKRNTEMDDTLKVEHEQFIEDLLKALKGEDNEAEKDPFKMDEEQEEQKFPIHDADTHWKLKRPLVGERYENPKQLKECITCYALANGFSIWYERSSTTTIIARCGSRPPRISDPTKGKQRKGKRYPTVEKGGQKDCQWRCYARWMKKEQSFQVISLKDEHSCSRNFRFGNLINYKWIGSKFGHRIRCNPEIKLIEIAELVLKKYKCQVTPSICSRARTWALNEYEKSLEEHYGLLRSYGDELLRSNPGSTVKLDVTVNPDEKTYFDRFYVCLNGLKEGWKRGCRRVIALDGCFLKGVCGGELLTAIGRDGNNHIFPVAWAVVNVENKDNWTWFLALVGEDLEVETGEGLTLISDQHKGLVQAVKDVMPNAEHRQCARHIYENFRKVFSGVEFRNLFWRASKASYPQLFESVMNEIRIANPSAHKYLMEREPKTWSRAYFEVNRGCDSVENGFSECFNFVLLKVRHKPIITMLEAIRIILMERMNTMRRICDTWVDDICPSIKRKLDIAKDQQRFWRVIPGGGSLFEVRMGNDAFTVNEENRTCTCRMWQLSGLPCHHAVAALFYIHKQPEEYVATWFRKDMYKVAYNHHLQPVQGMNQWKSNELNKPLPPKPKRMPGRPKKQRKKAMHEPSPHHGKISRIGSVMTCQKCHQVGHNRRGCKQQATQKPPKSTKPAGRPKKTDQGSVDKGKTEMTGNQSVDKGKTQMQDKGNAQMQDKGKGKMQDKGGEDKGRVETPSVGGFMRDARKSYNPLQTDEGTGKAKKTPPPPRPLPPRRRHSDRIAKMPKPPIKGHDMNLLPGLEFVHEVRTCILSPQKQSISSVDLLVLGADDEEDDILGLEIVFFLDGGDVNGETITAPLLRPRQASAGDSQSGGGGARPATLALLLGRASGRRGASMLVRETAARQLEERRADWGYSRPVVALDITWNLAFVAVSLVLLICTLEEKPNVPIRVWICGYALQCAVHVVLVWLEYRRRNRRVQEDERMTIGETDSNFEDSEDDDGRIGAFFTSNRVRKECCHAMKNESVLGSRDAQGPDFLGLVPRLPSLFQKLSFIKALFGIPYSQLGLWERELDMRYMVSYTKRCENLNTMASFVWWLVGFYWMVSGGEILLHNAPRLYWLTVVFLAFDVFFAIFCVVLACLIGIALCCCLPCIIAILYAVAGQEGASEADLSSLPKYRFQVSNDEEKPDVGAGRMVPVESNVASFAVERVLLPEDADCCICLSPYEDGTELHSLPCNHHFHAACIVKWLKMNATCPLCKYNILKGYEQV